MQHQLPNQTNELLISEQRCSEEIRSLATRHGWPVLEGVDATSAIHACVAMEPTRVCVEYRNPIRTVPDLLKRLSALQSVGGVACLVPGLSTIMEQTLARIGTQAFTTAECAARWLSSNAHKETYNSSDEIWDVTTSQRTAQRGIRVTRRLHMAPKGAQV